MINVNMGPMVRSNNGLVLIQVQRTLPNGHSRETAWSKPLGGDLYEIEGPLHLIANLNSNDIVKAVISPGDSVPCVSAVVKRSGFKTLHVVFSKGIPVFERQNMLEALTQWSVTYITPLDRFYTLEVNPEGNCQAACEYLSSLKLQGLIMYSPDVTIRALLRFRFVE